MRHFNRERFRQHVQFLRRQFLQDGDLPFTDVLTEEVPTGGDCQHAWRWQGRRQDGIHRDQVHRCHAEDCK